ncbi:MAG: hypothetical protein Q8O98_00010 [bacterium]|nr:hypothetical protein [bacterium]
MTDNGRVSPVFKISDAAPPELGRIMFRPPRNGLWQVYANHPMPLSVPTVGPIPNARQRIIIDSDTKVQVIEI